MSRQSMSYDIALTLPSQNEAFQPSGWAEPKRPLASAAPTDHPGSASYSTISPPSNRPVFAVVVVVETGAPRFVVAHAQAGFVSGLECIAPRRDRFWKSHR